MFCDEKLVSGFLCANLVKKRQQSYESLKQFNILTGVNKAVKIYSHSWIVDISYGLFFVEPKRFSTYLRKYFNERNILSGVGNENSCKLLYDNNLQMQWWDTIVKGIYV